MFRDLTKREAQERHARQRAEERFGFHLGTAQMQGMVQAIQQGEARFIHRQSNRVTLWLVEYVGDQAVAVYDSKRKTVCTLLPLRYLQRRGVTLEGLEHPGGER